MVEWCMIWMVVGAIAFAIAFVCSEVQVNRCPRTVDYDRKRVEIMSTINQPIEIFRGE